MPIPNRTFFSVLFFTLFVFFLNISRTYSQHRPAIQLTNNAVLYTYQDHDGYMWFGTYDGLVLYNGHEIVTYRHEPGNDLSLSSNIIYKITAAEKGFLWISTTLGLNKFSIKARKVVETYPDLAKTMYLDTDEQNESWILSPHATILHTTRKAAKNSMLTYPLQNYAVSSDDIRALFVHHARLCIVTISGQLLSKSLETIKRDQKVVFDRRDIHDKKIDRIAWDQQYMYFLDVDLGVYQYDITKQQKKLIANLRSSFHEHYGFVTQIAIYNNQVYVAFKNEGIMRVDPLATNKLIPITPGIPVFCMWPDRFQDLLWIGTDGLGVHQYSEAPTLFRQFDLKTAGITYKPVRALLADSLDNLWIGTNGDGLLCLSSAVQRSKNGLSKDHVKYFSRNDGLTSPQIFGMEKSQSHDLFWIGTENGLFYYSYPDRGVFEATNYTGAQIGKIHNIKEINDSTLWLASTGFGLIEVKITKKNNRISIHNAKNHYLKNGTFIADEIHSMISADNNELLIGTRGGHGVAQYNTDNNEYTFLPITKHNGMAAAIGDILCVHRGAENTLYIGSSAGFTKIKHIGQHRYIIVYYQEENGLINEMIHGILEDNDGYLWLSTNQGLVKYNPVTESFHNFSSPSLHIREFSDDAFWKCPQTNRLYFGGVNGVVVIDPIATTSVAQRNQNFHFFDIKVAGQSFPLQHFMNTAGDIVMPAEVNAFRISFAALDYLDNFYTYTYKLTDYHEEWNNLGTQNSIDFVNLPPGRYTLSIRYQDDVTEGSSIERTIKIIKLPPWYRSNTAYTLYTLATLMILVYLAYLAKKQAVKRHKLTVQKIEEDKQKELLESKLHFYTNVTHDLYTPLTLIKGVSELLKNHTMETTSAAYQRHVEILANNAEDLENLIHDLLRFKESSPIDKILQLQEEVNLSELTNRFLQSFRLIAKQAHITLREQIQTDMYWTTDPSYFSSILNNLLSNAFKYTPAQGTIEVYLSEEKHNIVLRVHNTGNGIEKEDLEKIFSAYHTLHNQQSNSYADLSHRTGLGLSLCKKLVESLQGEISVQSVPNTYTEFLVSLPKIEMDKISDSEIHTPALPLADTAHQQDAHSKSILVVDDHPDITQMIHDYLCNSYQVFIAADAKMALSLLEQRDIQLIITDLMLPEIDGIQLIQELKKNNFFKLIPLIIISAKVTTEQQKEGIQAGADVYLTKPFSLSMLSIHIERLLDKTQHTREYFNSPESAYAYANDQPVHIDEKKLLCLIGDIIEQHIQDPALGPTLIADKMYMSSRTLSRKIKAITKCSLMDFIKDYRFIMAEKLLLQTNLSVQEVMFKVGINNKSYFYREFSKRNAVTPREYRQIKPHQP